MFDYENECQKAGYKIIAGVDEAGRGPLAGPVSVAIVVMPLEKEKIIDGVNDSKKLTEKKREELYEKIVSTALEYHVKLIDVDLIDSINILNATKVGVLACINSLKKTPDMVLIDAVKIDADVPTKSIIKGDALSYSIACASILAKVTRDRLMLELDKEYPNYNFKKHKGYGTKEHIENLKKFGPCQIHRKSFIGHFVKVDDDK